MESMTGFGRAELTTRAGKFKVEISSVNNRFLEMSVRMPRQFSAFEPSLRELISGQLNRGKVYLFIGFERPDTSPDKYPINKKAARAYYEQLKALQRKLKLSGEIQLRDLLLLPEIGTPEREDFDEDLIWSGMQRVVSKAITELSRMRRREGAAMARDMAQRLKVLIGFTKQIITMSAGSAISHRDRLTTKINDLLDRPGPDNGRLEEEIAIIAEKTDISEECTRLLSHFDQARGNLKSKEPSGKKLNFILQEMNREANTIASKAADIEITRASISVKEEIEKLRELVQNVE